ncbi:MAG: MoxR family ATPase [Myxococcales bacterium]|nr:MoxR family ATPase [Myxococcales bacterium]
MQLDEAAHTAAQIKRQLEQTILGQPEVLDHALVTLLAGGHLLIEGPPGTAKTLLVRSLALALDATFRRIQLTPDLMPSDLVGVNVFRRDAGDFVFQPGPLFGDLVLADEINRAPAKTQSALLEAMQERQVSVDGVSHRLSPVFTVFATQNPVEYEGTYPLPEAQLDRFLLKTVVDYPAEDAERALVRRHRDGFDPADPRSYVAAPVADVERLLGARRALGLVRVTDELVAYITGIARGTRTLGSLLLGASPRAGVMLLRASRALALLRGRDFVTPDDVRDLAVPALRHRVVLSPETEIEGVSADRLIEQVLERVPVPRLPPPAP